MAPLKKKYKKSKQGLKKEEKTGWIYMNDTSGLCLTTTFLHFLCGAISGINIIGKGKENKPSQKQGEHTAEQSSQTGRSHSYTLLLATPLSIVPAEHSTPKKDQTTRHRQGSKQDKRSRTGEPIEVIEIKEANSFPSGQKRSPDEKSKDIHCQMTKQGLKTQKIINSFEWE